MGESISDRLEMLCVLSELEPHPESVPINALMAIEGTPLEKQEPIEALEMVRTVACARIMMPGSMVRLSAGRIDMLTAANPSENEDEKLLESLGMRPRKDSAAPIAGES